MMSKAGRSLKEVVAGSKDMCDPGRKLLGKSQLPGVIIESDDILQHNKAASCFP